MSIRVRYVVNGSWREPVTPFSAGSISIGLHPHPSLAATAQVQQLLDDARLAARGGFDGVTISEHHAGFPGYQPNPIQQLAVVLASLEAAGDVPTLFWGAPCPVLLPLRPHQLVVEDLAWLRAWFPHRIAVGFAPGYHRQDYDLFELDASDRASRYERLLGLIVRHLGPSTDRQTLLDDDAAVQEATDIPIVSAAGSLAAARRAAHSAVGLLLSPSSSIRSAASIVQTYREAGGDGPIVLIRRVWIGDDFREEQFASQFDAYRTSADDGAPWMSGLHYVRGEPEQVVSDLCTQLVEVGATCLNLRSFSPVLETAVIRHQMEMLAESVVPLLKTHLTPLRSLDRKEESHDVERS